jgi:predicted RNA-binding protein with PUA-like domain
MRLEREAYFDPTAFDPTHEHYDPKGDLDNPCCSWSMSVFSVN